jgi:hypothetical protein
MNSLWRAPRGFQWFLVAAFGSAAAWMAVAQQPRRVDDAALRDAGKTEEEWISYNVNWSEQRYSPLNQISGAGRGAAPATPAQPSRLLTFVLDGKAPLPGR